MLEQSNVPCRRGCVTGPRRKTSAGISVHIFFFAAVAIGVLANLEGAHSKDHVARHDGPIVFITEIADPANFGGVWTPWRDEAGVPYALYQLAEETHHDRLGGNNKPKPAVAATGEATGELAAVAEKERAAEAGATAHAQQAGATAAGAGAASDDAAAGAERRLAASQRRAADDASAYAASARAGIYGLVGALGGAAGAAFVLRQPRGFAPV